MSDFVIDASGKLTSYKGNEKCIIIPKEATVIGMHAFAFCGTLEEVVFHDEVKEIEPTAFEGKTKLKRVKFGNGLKVIGESAFQGSGLESVVIPGSVERIIRYSFASCLSLTDVVIEDGCRYIEYCAFYCLDKKPTLHIHLPTSISTIEDDGAFATHSFRGPNTIIYSGESQVILDYCRKFYYDRGLNWVYEPGELDIAMEFARKGSVDGKFKKVKNSIRGLESKLYGYKTEQSKWQAKADSLKGIFKARERKACMAKVYSLNYQIAETEKAIAQKNADAATLEEKIQKWNKLSYEEKRADALRSLRSKAKDIQKKFNESDKYVRVFTSDIMARMNAQNNPTKPKEPDDFLMPRIDVSDM